MVSEKSFQKLFKSNYCDDMDITCRSTISLSLTIGIATLFVYIIIIIRNLIVGIDFVLYDLERLIFISFFSFGAYLLYKKGLTILAKFLLNFSLLFSCFITHCLSIYFPTMFQ